MENVLMHPISFYLLQNLTMMLVMGYSSPSSPIRLAFLPLFFVGAWEVVPSCSRVLYRIPWAGLVGGNIIVSLFQYVEVALLSAWDFESKAPKSVPKDGDSGLKSDTISGQGPKLTVLRRGSLCQRMKFGYDVMTSTRNIGTPYMVKNTPAFSTKDPGYIPSRLAFCCRKATIIILAIFVIYLASQGSHSLEQNAVLYSAQAVPILASDRANLSSEEVVTRFVTVVGYWFCTYLAIDTFSSVFNLIFVALGLEDVRVYRPNFGPISEAYSIRQFWGVVWHQHLRKQLSSPAHFIVYEIFELKKGSLIGRYAFLFMAFLLSGLLHLWTEVGQGLTWQQSGQLHFFMTQFLGISIEDAVQGLYRYIRGVKRGVPPTAGTRLFGYMWVLIFFWWSTPAWFYPRLRLSEGDERDKILPFSIIGRILKA